VVVVVLYNNHLLLVSPSVHTTSDVSDTIGHEYVYVYIGLCSVSSQQSTPSITMHFGNDTVTEQSAVYTKQSHTVAVAVAAALLGVAAA
jgi:hypothetical protein